MEKTIHQGKNIARFRQILGIKQDLLASIMGDDWTQIKISRLEAKDVIDDAILEEVAKALKIPVEAIKNFDEETAIVNIQNNYDGANRSGGTLGNYLNYENCTFNTVDKIVELYERMLKEKDEIIEKLEKKQK